AFGGVNNKIKFNRVRGLKTELNNSLQKTQKNPAIFALTQNQNKPENSHRPHPRHPQALPPTDK
ncbi:hypothetical protein ACNIUX_27265, partial [Escherichia coli]